MDKIIKRSLKLFIPILSFSAIISTSAAASTNYLKGDFDVSGGQVDYQLPIQVAPGRAGHTPNLTFSYSSDGPNGILGVGWRIDGLSSIYRCGKNLAIDGKWGGVNLNSEDQYCIDGQRLVAITGKAGENATEYRTRKNDYRKIVSFGKLGSGPEKFKVWTKAGQVYEYGFNDNSRIKVSGRDDIYKWSLNKILEVSKKNSIDFTYYKNETNGDHRIRNISYLGGSVDFEYQERKDTQHSYLMGGKVEKLYRISSVVTKDIDNTEVATYNFSYKESEGTKRSLINKITQCAKGQCREPISFVWQSKTRPNFNSEKTAFDYEIKDAKYYDFGRDGNYEILAFSADKKTVKTNKDANYKASGWKHVMTHAQNSPCHDFVAADWDGNDRPIFRTFCSGNTPGNFLAYPLGNGRYREFYTSYNRYYGWARDDKFPIDKNGDGKFGIEQKCKECTFYDINGDGRTDEYLKTKNGFYLVYYKSNKEIQSIFRRQANKQLLTVADFNNDGYLDLLIGKMESHETRDKGVDNELEIFYFNGSKFISHGGKLKLSYKPPFKYRSYKCGGHKERSCHSSYYTHTSSELSINDVNLDGYQDIIIYDKVLINNGGYFSTGAQSSGYPALKDINSGRSAKLVNIIDLNSDGWPDNINGSKVRRSKPFAQDKIKQIKEYGLTYTVHYSQLANNKGIYSNKRYYKYPIVSTTPTKYVVSNFEVSPKGYGKTVTDFKYYNARSHLKGEGFLGFEKIERIRKGVNKEKIVTTFEVNDPILAGKTKEVNTYRNDHLVTKNTYAYSKKVFRGVGASYFSIFLNSKVERIYSGSKVEKQTDTKLRYDNFGNVLERTEKLSTEFDDKGIFEKVTSYSYLSKGDKKVSSVIDVTNSVKSSILNKYKKFQMMCRSDGTKYIKPSDEFVLIHGDVSIPIITKRYHEYYKLIIRSSSGGSGVATVHQAEFVPVSAAEYNKASTSSCGSYLAIDYDGDGRMELATLNKTVTQLITESGNNYWKAGAPISISNSIKDIKNNLTRSTSTSFEYTANGLLQSELLKPQQYENGDSTYGNVNKTILTSYEYDEYGNELRKTVSGTDTEARSTRTNYESNGIFPKDIFNALDLQTKFTYDNRFGLVTKTVGPVKDRTTSWSYDPFGRVSTEIRPGTGNQTGYQYLLGDNCPASTSKTVSCVVANNANGLNGVFKTVTQYDYAGREIRTMHQAFDGRWVYRDNVWDRDGRKVAITRPSFKRPDNRINSLPTVKFTYDERDREVLKQEPIGNNQWARYASRYIGLTTEVTDAKDNVKSITYNLLGHIVHTKEPLGAEQYYVNYPDGKLKKTTDSNGHHTIIRYDNLGYRTFLDDPDMGEWKYDYNIFGELVKKTDANNVTTLISYDGLGHKVREAQGKNISVWKYDAGLLSSFYGNGNKREFLYTGSGLVEEIRLTTRGKRLSTKYEYDGLERVKSEIRPNGLKLQNVYNEFGYHSAVVSPKDFVDDVFNDPSFKADVQKLIDEAKAQAKKYLDKAEDYAVKKSFFEDKAKDYASREIDLHNLDAQSVNLLKDVNRYKKYCDKSGQCYLQAATWVMLHDDITIPLDIDFDAYFKITSRHKNSKPGRMLFDSRVHKVSKQEFERHQFDKPEEWLLTDYDKDGTVDLVSRDNLYGASADSQTTKELLYTSEDLSLAAEIANSRYQYYYNLADKLASLAEQVGDLSGLYCDDANRLAGRNLTGRNQCKNNEVVSQVDHLNTILTQTDLEKLSGNDRYIFYWQRQSTDAYDHTLAETLGNGLVNSYIHDQFTGRPVAIATHRASHIVSHRNHSEYRKAGSNIRFLRYAYDVHNNVIRRQDLELGIDEQFGYDKLDRLTMSQATLDSPERHGKNNPDFNKRFIYDYDSLGNLIEKGDIHDYEYNSGRPHAVSKANGIRFTYDAVGNLVKGETGTTRKIVERALEWDGYNKPVKITRNGHTVEFAYDANQVRYFRKDSTGTETLYFDKLYEQITNKKTGEVQHKQYIYADGKLIALNIAQKDNADKPKDRQIRYLHYDALESVDLITDGYGNIVERRSFDPWGKARKVQWRNENDASTLIQFTLTNRGFTGHEHLKEVGLIHMNGRVYDEELGRFLSADPIIQSPYMTNSFNRYSYVWNNPMKYRDPTGYSLFDSCEVKGDCPDSRNPNDKQKPTPSNGNDGQSDKKNKTSQAINNEEYQQHRDGKFVADKEQELDGYYNNKDEYRSGLINGRVETIRLAEDVKQTLDVTTEQLPNQPRHSVQLTDQTVEIASAVASVTMGPAGQLAVTGIGVAVKADQTVKVAEVTTSTATYDVYSAKAKYNPSTNEMYSTDEPVKTGRQVTYTRELYRTIKEVNVRDKTGKPNMVNAPTSPPSQYNRNLFGI